VQALDELVGRAGVGGRRGAHQRGDQVLDPPEVVIAVPNAVIDAVIDDRYARCGHGAPGS
jgi:hypothetical protein